MIGVKIIGCGSIGALKPYEFDNPNTADVLTWAHAVYNHPELYIHSFEDMDSSKAHTASERWGAEPEGSPMISIIASPTETHLSILEKELNEGRELIIVEKPAGSDPDECEKMIRLSEEFSTPVAVNYTRRFLHATYRVDAFLAESSEIYGAVLYYNRGLLRDGCHGIDLFRRFFGEVKSVKTSYDIRINDYSPLDPTLLIHFEMAKCKTAIMIPVDGRKCSMFNMDIVTSHGSVRLHNNCHDLEIHGLTRSPYGDYRALDTKPLFTFNRLHNDSIQEALHTILMDTSGGYYPECDLEDALSVHQVIYDIHKGDKK